MTLENTLTMLGLIVAFSIQSVYPSYAQDKPSSTDAVPTERRIYLTLNAGGELLQDFNVKTLGGLSKAKFEPGFRIDVAGGYDFTDWLAVELEVGVICNS